MHPSSTAFRYRRSFDLPAGCVPASLSVILHVDNEATVSLNGVRFGATPRGEIFPNFQDPVEGPYTASGPFVASGNILELAVWNYGGPSALNYEATLTCADDATPPTVTCEQPDGVWHASDVTIECTASDSGSGLADPADASFTLTTSVPDGEESSDAATDSREVCDNAGNCTTAGPVTGLRVDRRAPELSCAAPDGAWHADNVSLACSASDGGSGLANGADASFALTTSVPAGSEDGDAATDSRTVCDTVGNCSTAGPIGGNKVDRGAPTLFLPDSFAVNATSPAGAVVVYAAAATDGADPAPAVSCERASGKTFPIGTTTVECVATDHVGNVSTGTFTVHVKGAREQIDDLVAKTKTMLGIEHSEELRGQLKHVLDALLARDPARACNLLKNQFAKAVAKAALTDEQKNELLADATRIRAVIGCK